MSLFSGNLESPPEPSPNERRDLYRAETQSIDARPKMAKAAADSRFKRVFIDEPLTTIAEGHENERVARVPLI